MILCVFFRVCYVQELGYDLTSMEQRPVGVGSIRWNTPIEGLRIADTLTNGTADFDVTVDYGAGTTDGHVQRDFNYINVFSTEYTWEELVLVAEFKHQKYTDIISGLGAPLTSLNKTYLLKISVNVNWVTIGFHWTMRPWFLRCSFNYIDSPRTPFRCRTAKFG